MGTKYIDQVWCDVVDMTMCHLLLGKPWQDDKAAIYDETKNTYSFMLGKTKLTLLQSHGRSQNLHKEMVNLL
jgi:hypothetical protein